MRVTEADREQYRSAGYAVIKGVVPEALRHALGRTLVSAFRKFEPAAPDVQGSPWDERDLHARLADFRRRRPRDFGVMYDTVQTSVALWHLGTHEQLSTIAAEFMDDDRANLSVTDMLLRMDAPGDTRNKLEWHQDSSYFRQNKEGRNGCVCWMTLRSLLPEHGPLEILPASQTLGRVTVASQGKNDAITSEQFPLPADVVSRFTPLSIIADAG